ncbi:MAG: 4-hydroxy-3-methylbut-2-enyl diphosphate reductase [Sulfuricurvum sp. PC08-66]|nr:MAG: 4-hydroxy-3-methylbut-2-enyl diphosphate reductase [Sulfuricurvum sp. PC08-66]
MKITMAENFGFCFGVKRAIKIAENTPHATTYGPLIHNKKEIDRLWRTYDVSLGEDIETFKSGDTVIIRTHGIEKEDLNYLNQKGVVLVDATCPFVTKPQEIVEQMSNEGYDIVIFGDENHPEIKGVRSYAKGAVCVVQNIEDFGSKRLSNKIALIAQTTRKMENYQRIASHLIANYGEVRVFNTICNATFENQEATRKLAQSSDIVIVIGGKDSSNTRQLLYIAKEFCVESYLVEGLEDIDPLWFRGKKMCGITAGASTPQWIIEQIHTAISTLPTQS